MTILLDLAPLGAATEGTDGLVGLAKEGIPHLLKVNRLELV